MIKYLIIIFIPIALIGQTSIESLFKKSGFYFEDVNIQFSSDILKDIKTYQFKLDELKIKLSDLESHYNLNDTQKVYDFKIKGPDITINKVSLESTRFSNNWIINERIKQLKKRESLPKNNLIIIRDAIIKYEVDNLKLPKSLNQLSINNYYDPKMDSFTNQNWNYYINLPKNIFSEPSSLNPFSENKEIIYDWVQKDFNINPELDSLEKSINSHWIIKLDIKQIKNLLTSSINVKTDSGKTNYQIQIDKSDFEINELILDIDLEKSIIFYHGKINLKIQNFEIKIPSELREEPLIQKTLEEFGIWNNSLLIKELNIFLNVINENTSEIEIFFNAPFMKINLIGGISIKQSISPPEIFLNRVKAEINPISFGLKTLINKWEKKHKVELKRDNGIIILDLDDLINNPLIKNLEKPISFFKSQHD